MNTRYLVIAAILALSPSLFAKSSKKRVDTAASYTQLESEDDLKKYKKTRWEMGLGVPHLLFVKASRKLDREFSLGIGFGTAPAHFFVPELRSPENVEFSEDYDISIQPRANIYTIQTDLEYRTSRNNSFSFGAQLFYLNAGGDSSIRDSESGNSAMLANIDVNALIPMLNLSYNRRIWNRKSGAVILGIGVNYLMDPMIGTTVKGALPSQASISPAARESLSDGLGDIKDNANDFMTNQLSKYRVLPTVKLSWTWD